MIATERLEKLLGFLHGHGQQVVFGQSANDGEPGLEFIGHFKGGDLP